MSVEIHGAFRMFAFGLPVQISPSEPNFSLLNMYVAHLQGSSTAQL